METNAGRYSDPQPAEAICMMRDLVYLQTGLSWEFFRDESEVVKTWIAAQ